MKKKFFSLLLVIALVLSCVFVLASCGGDDEEPEVPSGDNVDNSDVKVDEGIGNANGEGGVYVVTDPQNAEAGAATDPNYTRG